MWPRGGQKEKEETESENRPYTLNTHSEAEGGKVFTNTSAAGWEAASLTLGRASRVLREEKPKA